MSSPHDGQRCRESFERVTAASFSPIPGSVFEQVSSVAVCYFENLGVPSSCAPLRILPGRPLIGRLYADYSRQ